MIKAKRMKPFGLYENEQQSTMDEEMLDDDSSSFSHNSLIAVTTQDTKNDTLLLAEFLSTTGPEEYSNVLTKMDESTKKQLQFRRASRLLSRLRRRPLLRSEPILVEQQQQPLSNTGKRNYIPLPVYEESNEYLLSIGSATNDKPITTNANTTTAFVKKSHDMDHRTKTNRDQSMTHDINMTTCHYQPKNKQQLRDSGIYSEINSEKETFHSGLLNEEIQQFPQPPPFTTATATTTTTNTNTNTNTNTLLKRHKPYEPGLASSIATTTTTTTTTNKQQQQQQPQRPAPLPPAVASAVIAASVVCSPHYSKSQQPLFQSVPEAALNRRSVRLRHVQVQTNESLSSKEEEEDMNNNNKKACPHCRQVIYNNKPFPPQKRLSSPPVLPSGRLLSVSNKSITTENNNDILLDMIMKLKAQLDEEKQCRLKLEKVIQQQQRSFERREVLAKEKDKWANDRLWLNDRISFLLPE